jgi:hypothetical protein
MANGGVVPRGSEAGAERKESSAVRGAMPRPRLADARIDQMFPLSLFRRRLP